MKQEGTALIDLGKLQNELREAHADFLVAEEAAREADRVKTDASVRLSKAQQALDQALKILKDAAPWSTHWSDLRRGVKVEP